MTQRLRTPTSRPASQRGAQRGTSAAGYTLLIVLIATVILGTLLLLGPLGAGTYHLPGR